MVFGANRWKVYSRHRVFQIFDKLTGILVKPIGAMAEMEHYAVEGGVNIGEHRLNEMAL
jgi:hypothetical protein